MGIVARVTSAFGVTAKGSNLANTEVDTNMYLVSRGLGLDPVTITGTATLTSTAHEGRQLIFNSASAFTVTIALESAGGATALGARYYGVNIGAGAVTIAISAGGTLTGVSSTVAQNGAMTAIRTGLDTYVRIV